MIKLSKPVQLLQWGEGTNTTNQRWIEVGKGRIAGNPRRQDGVTDVVIVLDGSLSKIDAKRETDFVKIMQQGEGMTPRAARWGEVAMGTLKSVSSSGGQTLVTIAVKAATKVGP